ncbi:hypothetical protein [Nocardia sp. NPDC057353]|uniref:hypothetical protein n=1 Tax=Nocardia sp. NPDC057353 TaxID=3346104 RepID=UPI003637008A
MNRHDELMALRSDLVAGLELVDQLTARLRAGLELVGDILQRPELLQGEEDRATKCGDPNCRGFRGLDARTGQPVPCYECRPHLAKPAVVKDSDPKGWNSAGRQHPVR